MAVNIDPVENHRQREKGVLVYPVYSRRSNGLSVGINLYPAKKGCPFNCPYCEVFPFANNTKFSLEQMEDDLRECIANSLEQGIQIKDICFSGNGEPTLAPSFPIALEAAAAIHSELNLDAEIVVITNGAGLLQPEIFSLLADAAALQNEDKNLFDIWLKLDAGTPQWYEKINRSAIPYKKLYDKIKEFTALAPVTIQTMLCSIDGSPPPEEEALAWQNLLLELGAAGNLRKVQIYGKARPAPEDPKASSLPAEYLEQRALKLRQGFALKGITTAVDIYL